MRQAILFALGLAVGAIATANVISALHQRDAYARGLMHVMQHDFGALRDATRENRCDARTAATLEQLRGLADGIEAAVYGADPPEASFAEYAKRLRAAIPPALECKNLAQAADRIGTACDGCHREYR